MCVCVCVCERERERERETKHIKMFIELLQQAHAHIEHEDNRIRTHGSKALYHLIQYAFKKGGQGS